MVKFWYQWQPWQIYRSTNFYGDYYELRTQHYVSCYNYLQLQPIQGITCYTNPGMWHNQHEHINLINDFFDHTFSQTNRIHYADIDNQIDKWLSFLK